VIDNSVVTGKNKVASTASTQTDESHGIQSFIKNKMGKKMAFLELTRLKEDKNYSDSFDVNQSKAQTFQAKNLDDDLFSEDDDLKFALKTNESSSFYDTFRDRQKKDNKRKDRGIKLNLLTVLDN